LNSFSYSTLEREDRGVDEDYCFRNLRRMTICAALLSVPLWLAIGAIALHFINQKAGR
jgi:hypothetical protein